jgi:hypothetical protein
VSGLGSFTSSLVDDKIRKLAEISPMAQSLIYSIGAGDDTITAMQQADLDQVLSGEGGLGQHDVRQTSNLYNFGKWAQAEGYEALGITPELQERWAYKIPSVIGQVVGLVGTGVAATAASGGNPVAGWAAVMGTAGSMQFGEAYDQARAMGVEHDQAFNIAGRNAVVMMALEAISMRPIMSGMAAAKTARAAGQGLGRPAGAAGGMGAGNLGALPAAVPTQTGASAFEQALMKRGFNIRKPMTQRLIRTGQASFAEGMEEALTGMHLDMELYRSGTHWRPGKTWAQIVFGPQRLEEFALGAIGGGVVTGVVGGGQMEFTPARKEAAKLHYGEAANNSGTIPSDAKLEKIFRAAENRVRNAIPMSQTDLLNEMEAVKEQGRRALSAEAEVEAALVLDGYAELLPVAKSRNRTPADEARAKAAPPRVPETETDAAAEEGAVARDLMTTFKRWGTASYGAMAASIQNVLNSDGFTNAQKKAARTVARVLQKVKRAEAAVEEYNNQELQADQLEQQARDMEAQVSAEELTQLATQQREELLKAWDNPEKRQQVIDKHMHPDLPVELATGRQIDSRTVMSAYLDMPGPPGTAEGTTMRDAIAEAMAEQDMMEQNAYGEQIAELEEKAFKLQEKILKQQDAERSRVLKEQHEAEQQQLKAQQLELKQQRLDQQAALQQMQFEQQLEQLQQKDAESQDKAQLSQEKMDFQRQRLADQKKKAEEQKKKEAEDQKKYDGEKDRNRKKAMDAQYKRDAKKAVVENLRGRHPKPKKAREILSKLPEKDAAEVLSTPLEKTGRSKSQAQRDKALNLTNVNDLLTNVELRAKASKTSAKNAEAMKPNDPSNDQAPHPRAPKETDKKVQPIHKGDRTRIVYQGKRTTARSGNTFTKNGVEYLNWERYDSKKKKWEKMPPMPTEVFRKLMRDAAPGRRPKPTPAQQSTGTTPLPVTSSADNNGRGAPPPVPPADPPNDSGWSRMKRAMYIYTHRLGDLVAHYLGDHGALLRRYSLNSGRMSSHATNRFEKDVERAAEWVRKTFGEEAGRTEKGPAARFRNWLLEMRDLRAEIADFRSKLNNGEYTEAQREWVEGEIALREEALEALGINPADLGYEANTNDLGEALEYARRKAEQLENDDIYEDTGRKKKKRTGKSPRSQLHRTKRVQVNMDLAKYDTNDGVYRVDRENLIEFLKDARGAVIPALRPVYDGVLKLMESVPVNFRPDLALSVKEDGYLLFNRSSGVHVLGQYNGTYHEVVMPITEPGKKARNGKQTVAINGKTLLHELIHAMTVDGITDNVGPYAAARGVDENTDRLYKAQDMAVDIAADIRALMNELKKHPEITAEDLDAYGFTNEKEFLAEALSNPKFQKILAKIDAPEGFFNTPSRGGKRSSIWAGIVETVRKMLKLPPKSWTALDVALKLTEEAAQSTQFTQSVKAYNLRANQRRYAKEDEKYWGGDTPEVDVSEDGVRETEGDRMRQEEALYWKRRALYLEDLMTHHPDTVVRVMHDLDSIGTNIALRKHLPALNAARYHYNLAWAEKAKHARREEGETLEDAQRRMGKVPNHTYQGLSEEFLERIKSGDPKYRAEREFVKEELKKELFPGDNATDEALAAAERLRIELNISDEADLAQLDAALDVIVTEVLNDQAPEAYSKVLTNFGSFVRERRGLWGSQVTDLSDNGTLRYLDRAYRDIAEEEMYQEFYRSVRTEDGTIIPPTDPQYEDHAGGRPAYHSEPKYTREGKEIPDKKDAWKEVFNTARTQDTSFPSDWLHIYMGEARGRQLGGDSMLPFVSALAKWSYLSKLGGLATLIRNATILGSMALMLGPKNMMLAMAHVPLNWREASARALEAGAANKLQDATFEFEGYGPATNASLQQKLSAGFSYVGLYLFSKEEIFLRTVVADAASRYYRANIDALRGEQSEGDAALFEITPDEARKNLRDLEFTDREIALLEANEVHEAEMLTDFENRAMYHGSTLINFRGGADFLPVLLSNSNSSMARFLRVFNSFAYNILVAQAKYIWSPALFPKRPGERRAGIKRMIAVYGGGLITAEVAQALIAMIRPEDDEDELHGLVGQTLHNIGTVGLLGKFERPGESILSLESWLGGVNLRSISNGGKAAFQLARASGDFFSGEFQDSAKQAADAMAVLLMSEISHVRAMRDLRDKAGWKNKGAYMNARQISRTRSKADMSLTDRWAKENSKFIKSKHAPWRQDVVNAIVAGKPAVDIKNAGRKYVERIVRKDDKSAKDALQSARQSVMMYAPLSEFSRTTDIEKAKTELEEFRADMTKRRGAKEADRLIAMHLAYVEGCNLALPRTK